jgi:hypothetical protein
MGKRGGTEKGRERQMWRRREERGDEREYTQRNGDGKRKRRKKKKQNCECMLLNIELIIHFFRL